ncbi:coat protein [ssRNA phage Zoerhiza.1_6]|uniref:Coat protein n=2 Tax=Leviviricetes TaxID=2842243 RepID=A0A8S5KZY8_9VIRU|nr:coat protein [ssRNA phage Zoerhiza.1_6]QDH90983.1 MAG: hypothetical protein H1Rhizo25566_000002 [Leviviridae sp.]DAD51270.1 TPA_asm: coat protein [ssRNA phage Zoerhiza.1_6]
MFLTDIVSAGDSSSTRTYSLRSILDGSSVRANSAAPLNAPETLTIKHSKSSRGGIPLDRHLARFDLTKINSSSAPVVASVYVNIEVPEDAVITAAIIKDMRTQLTNFLSDANVAKLLNGEP